MVSDWLTANWEIVTANQIWSFDIILNGRDEKIIFNVMTSCCKNTAPYLVIY